METIALIFLVLAFFIPIVSGTLIWYEEKVQKLNTGSGGFGLMMLSVLGGGVCLSISAILGLIILLSGHK